MSETQPEFEFSASSRSNDPCVVKVTLDGKEGAFVFEFPPAESREAPWLRARLIPNCCDFLRIRTLDWKIEGQDDSPPEGCSAWAASVNAFLTRVRKKYHLGGAPLEIGAVPASDLPGARAGEWVLLNSAAGPAPWKWLGRVILNYCRLFESMRDHGEKVEAGAPVIMEWVICAALGCAPPSPPPGQVSRLFDLRVTLNFRDCRIELAWLDPATKETAAFGTVHCPGVNVLTWEVETGGVRETRQSSHAPESIRVRLNEWLHRFPANRDTVRGFQIPATMGEFSEPECILEPPFKADLPPTVWIFENIQIMAEERRLALSPMGRLMDQFDQMLLGDALRHEQKLLRKERKRAEEERQRHERMERLAEERRRREREKAVARKAAEARRAAEAAGRADQAPENAPRRQPVPPVAVRFEMPRLEFQDTVFPLENARGYSLRERAALWWVSNQSDDLLCLPGCRIERLEYQIRSALRVLGPLRGRALLSDEVGLGKTIEAGLVIKELFTRGMVRRFLVLTVPSLVDQWEEELNEKFSLTVATTNRSEVRNDPRTFWTENRGIVASLHTLKQPAHLAVARQVPWDILVVDEAHYLRNRESQAWQAVNSLPRQFLLLLTATPVQNSLEELYNLITLLQPGQLPSPKEFRARFLNPGRPRQPREPEELRRLLGQVMIRNTRANAGIQLPSRRAETVMFEPDPDERAFWRQWEDEFRASLSQLSASEGSLWGRLVLQAAGSSPAAWRAVLEKFPGRAAARRWREQAPLEASWRRKCGLIPPLTRVEGGAVVFTQFLETQAALAEFLRSAGVDTFLINGSTPPPERQPITERFRKQGGALLLTHSGTEGRNLQFSHHLANFDLPWNPMEIEQRIGRLHRLGQRHPVRIYNFVQAGTLQEHVLEILQEKLNLFELVVGETGLILGDRFSGDDFAEEVFRRWRESQDKVAEAIAELGTELAAARGQYSEVKKLDETLFAQDYEAV